jgi:hypothetical protein
MHAPGIALGDTTHMHAALDPSAHPGYFVKCCFQNSAASGFIPSELNFSATQ